MESYLPKHTYFEQEQFYTCGAACARMVLSTFMNPPTEEELVVILGTNDKTGTSYEALLNLTYHYDLECICEENGTMERLHELDQAGYTIIVAYDLELPHYAVYLRQDASRIFLSDPFRGNFSSFTKGKFQRKWKINRKGWEDKHSVGWLCAFKAI